MSRIGPTFGAEIVAAGLGGLPFAWTPDGLGDLSDLTPEQRAGVEAVLAAHDPEALPPIPRDPLAEIDTLRKENEALKAALIKDNVTTQAKIDAEKEKTVGGDSKGTQP